MIPLAFFPTLGRLSMQFFLLNKIMKLLKLDRIKTAENDNIIKLVQYANHTKVLTSFSNALVCNEQLDRNCVHISHWNMQNPYRKFIYHSKIETITQISCPQLPNQTIKQ